MRFFDRFGFQSCKAVLLQARAGFVDLAVIAVFVLVSAIVAVPITYVANQTNTDDRSRAALSCPGGTCPDGWSYGPDNNAPQSSCDARHQEACANHQGGGGSNPTNPTNPANPSTTCSGSAPTASTCRGRAVGSACNGFPGTCVKNDTQNGQTICGCKENATPVPAKTTLSDCTTPCFNTAGCTCPSTCNNASVSTYGGTCGGARATIPPPVITLPPCTSPNVCYPSSACVGNVGSVVGGSCAGTNTVCCKLAVTNTPTACDPTYCMPSAECGGLGGSNTGKTCTSGICCSKKESGTTDPGIAPICPNSERCMDKAVCAGLGGSAVSTYTCGTGTLNICCSKTPPKATPQPICPDANRCMSKVDCALIGGTQNATYACSATDAICCSKLAPKPTPKPTPKAIACEAKTCDADQCFCPASCKNTGYVDRGVNYPCGGSAPLLCPYAGTSTCEGDISVYCYQANSAPSRTTCSAGCDATTGQCKVQSTPVREEIACDATICTNPNGCHCSADCKYPNADVTNSTGALPCGGYAVFPDGKVADGVECGMNGRYCSNCLSQMHYRKDNKDYCGSNRSANPGILMLPDGTQCDWRVVPVGTLPSCTRCSSGGYHTDPPGSGNDYCGRVGSRPTPTPTPKPIACTTSFCDSTAGCMCPQTCISPGKKSYATANPCGGNQCYADGAVVGQGVGSDSCCSKKVYWSGNTMRCGTAPTVGCNVAGNTLAFGTTACRTQGDTVEYKCVGEGDGSYSDSSGKKNLILSRCATNWKCYGNACVPPTGASQAVVIADNTRPTSACPNPYWRCGADCERSSTVQSQFNTTWKEGYQRWLFESQERQRISCGGSVSSLNVTAPPAPVVTAPISDGCSGLDNFSCLAQNTTCQWTNGACVKKTVATTPVAPVQKPFWCNLAGFLPGCS